MERGLLSRLCENVIFQFCVVFRNEMSCTNIPPNQNKVFKHNALGVTVCYVRSKMSEIYV